MPWSICCVGRGLVPRLAHAAGDKPSPYWGSARPDPRQVTSTSTRVGHPARPESPLSPDYRRRPTLARSRASLSCNSSELRSAYFFGNMRRFEASKTAMSSMYSSISMSRLGR